MGCFEAREWLQQFWDSHGRLPAWEEVPVQHRRYFRRSPRPVPIGWELELQLARALANLGLYVYPYSPRADGEEKVDLSFELGTIS